MNTTTAHPAARPFNRFRTLHGSPPRSSGFTLVEMLITVAVAGVLLALSVPSFSRLLISARLTDASNALLSSMHLARSEAIKRNGRVTLCKSANGIACSSAGGWEQGWIVFHDANQDGERDSDETIIERMQPLANGLKITGNLRVGNYVSFLANGLSRLNGGGFQAGTVTLCNQSGAAGEGRQIVLNAVGRPRVQKLDAVQCA